MAGTSQYYTFATGSGANLEALTDYYNDPTRLNGEQPGIAKSARFNRALRQSSVVASGVAQFIANSGLNVNDDGNPNTIANGLNTAVNAAVASGSFVPLNGSQAMTGALTTPGATIGSFTIGGNIYGSGPTFSFNIGPAADNSSGHIAMWGSSSPSNAGQVYIGNDQYGFNITRTGRPTINGNAVLDTGGGQSIGGSLTVQSFTATGSSSFQALTATAVTATGTVSAAGLSSSSGLTVSSGPAAVQALTATNMSASGTLNVAGSSVVTAISATNVNASGTLNVSGATTVAGLTSGAHTAASLTSQGVTTTVGINSSAAESLTSPTISTALARLSNGTLAARADYVRAQGKRFSALDQYSTSSVSLSASDLGKQVVLTGVSAVTMPDALAQPDTLSIANYGPGSVTVSRFSSSTVLVTGPGVNVVSSFVLPAGAYAECGFDPGGGAWWCNIIGVANRLSLVSSGAIANGTQNLDFTFTADQYETARLEFDSAQFSSAPSGTSLQFYVVAGGTEYAVGGSQGVNSGTTSFGAATARLVNSMLTELTFTLNSSGTNLPTSTYAFNAGTGAHPSTLRLSARSGGTTYPFSSGNYRFKAA